MKPAKDLEDVDPFVSVNLLEHNDTIECLQDFNSLQASDKDSTFPYAKKVQVTEELDDKWKYDGATNIFEILDDQISN